jgi:quercetin dioxygenase-like cupin family protein
MSAFDSVSGVRPYKIWDGAVARAVHGKQITMAIVEVGPGVDVPTHQHANEQLGFVLKGSIVMTVAGEERELQVGETYVIHGDTPHKAVGGSNGASVVDVFSPPRADWERLERLEPSPGNWP